MKFQKERASLVLLATNSGSWEYDIVNDSVFFDDEMLALFGLSHIDKTADLRFFTDLIHTTDQVLFESFFDLLKSQRPSVDTENTAFSFTFKTKTNEAVKRYIKLQCKCEFENDQNITDIFGVCTDVTEINASHELLGRQNTLAQQHSMQLDELAHAKTHFINNVRHELRTPMSTLSGALQMLNEYQLDSDLQSIIELANDSSEKLLAVVNKITTFAEIDQHSNVRKYDEVDIKVMLENIAQLHTQNLSKNITFHVELARDFPISCSTDANKVSQIVNHLVSNAVKFTAAGEIKITAKICEETLMIEVSDTGTGIESQHIDDIFQPFALVDISNTRANCGLGMGLAISKKLVRTLDGTITVKSQKGHGSRFLVSLPLRAQQNLLLGQESGDPNKLNTH